MVRRHEIHVLRRAGHSLAETVRLVGVSQSSVQRVAAEPAVTTFDTDANGLDAFIQQNRADTR